MPPTLGLINLSTGDLIAAAGGDPWQINDGLQAGDPGAINAQADAFHTAAGSATEVEDDFRMAKQRFEKGWRHNGSEHPINESTEVTRTTTTVDLQKPQLAKIALELETVAAALATTQRTCDARIAGLDNFLHGVDDEISVARAANQDTQELHGAAIAAVQVALGDILDARDGYATTMASAEAAIAAVQNAGSTGTDGGAGSLGTTGGDAARGTRGDGGAGGLGPKGSSPAVPPPAHGGTSTPAAEGSTGLSPTKTDVILGGAGAITGGTADGVGKSVLGAIADGPKTGPGAPSPGLWKFLEDPKVGGIELKGFSRLGRVAGAASAIPAVFSDIHDGNSVAEAVTREGVGTGVGLWAGAAGGGFLADLVAGGTIGSVAPGAGTAVGVVAGAGISAVAAFGGSKLIEAGWRPAANAVGSAIHGVKSALGFG